MRSPAILSIALLASLLTSAPAGAQTYRSVGPDGRVTYSDIPPSAANATNTRGSVDSGGSRNGGGAAGATGSAGAAATAGLPYALAQVARQYPVTLYASQNCVPCNAGRNLLINRGIPFSEKTVESNDDIAALKKIAGSANLPLLTIGSQQLSGFQDGNWSQYLDAAGYPAASQLPGSYHRPSATPLVAARAQKADPAPAPTTPAPVNADIPVTAPPDPNNPAGIQF